jgi:WD40 repeat protein
LEQKIAKFAKKKAKGMTQRVLLCALCALLFNLFAATCHAEESAAAREAAGLVEQLGSERFEEREKAERRLLEIGAEAWDAVSDAARHSTDLEVRFRAGKLLGVLQRKKFAEVRRWDDHQDIVWAVAFSPDSQFLATGGGGQHNNGEWSAGSDFAIRIRDVKTGDIVRRLEGHTNTVNNLAWSPDGSLFYSCSSDNTVRGWNVATGKTVITFRGHEGGLSAMSLSKDGKRLVTGSWDATSVLWNAETGEQIRKFDRHYGRVWGVAISPDAKTIALCGDHPYIRLVDAETGAIQAELQGHEQAAVRVEFSPDGTRLISGGWDNAARLWNVKERTLIKSFPAEGRVEGVAWSNDGKQILAGSLDHKLRLFDVDSGTLLQTYEGFSDAATRVAISPDGRYIAAGSWDHSVRIWPAAK